MVDLRKCPEFFNPTPQFQRPELDSIEAFFTHHSKVMDFLLTDGLKLFKQQEPLIYQEWATLFDWVFSAWYNGLGDEYTQRLLEITISRGIMDLGRFIGETDTSSEVLWEDYCGRGEIVGEWVTALEYNLCHERIKLLAERNKLIAQMRDYVRIPLYRKFLPLAAVEDDYLEWFRSLAVSRHPGDTEAQEMYMHQCVHLAIEGEPAKSS